MKPNLPATLAAAAMAGAVVLPAAEDAPAARYQTIVARNLFALREPPPPPPIDSVRQPVTPPPKVVVTGLTDLGGIRKALIEITETGKPVTRAILIEGEAHGAVCVLRIDLPANRVKIRVRDTESFLELQAPNSPAGPESPPRGRTPMPAPFRG